MKPRFLIAVLLVIALIVPAWMLAQQNSKAEKEIRAVLDELREANLKGGAEGAAILDKYLADDVVRIPPNGALYTKAELLDGFRTGKIKVEAQDNSDIKIHIYGNTAVVSGLAKRKSSFMGSEITGQDRWTRVFVKRNGVWKNVLYQQTKTAQ
jgi:hypothetical protein